MSEDTKDTGATQESSEAEAKLTPEVNATPLAVVLNPDGSRLGSPKKEPEPETKKDKKSAGIRPFQDGLKAKLLKPEDKVEVKPEDEKIEKAEDIKADDKPKTKDDHKVNANERIQELIKGKKEADTLVGELTKRLDAIEADKAAGVSTEESKEAVEAAEQKVSDALDKLDLEDDDKAEVIEMIRSISSEAVEKELAPIREAASKREQAEIEAETQKATKDFMEISESIASDFSMFFDGDKKDDDGFPKMTDEAEAEYDKIARPFDVFDEDGKLINNTLLGNEEGLRMVYGQMKAGLDGETLEKHRADEAERLKKASVESPGGQAPSPAPKVKKSPMSVKDELKRTLLSG